MRTSQSSSRFRRIPAALAVGATAAVMLAATATPALAVGPVAIDDSTGFTGGGDVINVTSSAQFGTGTNGVTFSSGATCPATYTTSGTNLVAASVVHTDASNLVVTVPATVVAPVAYKVCVYLGTTVASSALVNSPNTAPVYTVSPAAPVLSTTGGITGGGNSITATLTNFLTVPTAPAAVFSVAACPTTYGTPTSNLAATVTKTSVTVGTLTVPAGVVMPNTYNVCIYTGNTAAATLIADSSADYTPTPPTAVLSPTSGLTGGGNSITVTSTSNYLNGVSSPGVAFSVATCPSTFTASPANLVGTATRLSDTVASVVVPAGVVSASPGPAYNVCVYNGSDDGVSTLVGTSAAAYTATVPTVALSTNVGVTATSTPITVSSTNNFLNGVSAAAATLSAPACTSTYSIAAPGTYAATTTKIANNKAVVTVPTSVVSASPGPAYNVCIYSSNSGPLIASSGNVKYSVGSAITIGVVSPAGGPALGGNKISIAGTGLPTTPGSISATIGGYPLVVTPVSATEFTAIVPAHEASGPLPIKVVTPSGTFYSSGTYTYSNGVVIAPNTTSNTAAPIYVDVQGVGFAGINFTTTTGTTSTDTNGHVYLVSGAYDPTDTAGKKATPPIAECTNVLVINDTELICTVDAGDSLSTAGAAVTTPVPDGTYTMTVVSDGRMDVQTGGANADVTFTKTVVSSGSTFTVADY
ncbi:hypothetical protein GCM10020358_08190 [Amorphoplanes nipponensis]|uniref:IPT/TIG domain-containing protein n=1 Tax=Actinoplanes nipponensis TaxID=135950 RepID=A0A919JES8_9ACTN|nr:IPT/TIG domain-containing protein [Actinoplanes nipponensis]GIE48025.1 hypothetical protein Ani05nite_15590 [Actinoplanes nipponensis]